MPKVNYNVVKQTPKPVTNEKIYCRKCMRQRSSSTFYECTNPMIDTNGKMSICSDCCNGIYDYYFSIYSSMRDAIIFTCRDLDIRFSERALEQTQSHIDKLRSTNRKSDVVFGYYKSKLSSLSKNNEGIEEFRYKDSEDLINIKQDVVNNTTNNTSIELSESDFILTEEIVKHWGKGKDDLDYEFLEDQMYKIKSSFECPDYGMEMIMKDICFINLDIETIRQEGKDVKGDINKLIETRSKLMNDAKMKPIQATGAEANDQITFGMLIKKLENERPTDEPLDEWKDPDNFEKWHKIFVGHLADMNDIENDVTKEYREIIKPYTVARQDEDEVGES